MLVATIEIFSAVLIIFPGFKTYWSHRTKRTEMILSIKSALTSVNYNKVLNKNNLWYIKTLYDD